MKKLTLFYLPTLLFMLLITNTSKAQEENSNISGIVTDEQKKPIDYITIALYKIIDSSLVKTAITDPSGKFNFSAVNNGKYFVKAAAMGYTNFKSSVFNIENASINLGTLQLKATTNNLKEVNVTSTPPLIVRKLDRTVMNVENSSVAVGLNALEVLQKAPGVTIDQNDNIAMQGKQGVLIMLDGKQTYMSNSDMANLLRNMQSNQIESIELITNPSSKYDASGNSGIINIKTKKSKGYGANGSVNAVLGMGKSFRGSTGVNLNFRNKNYNLYGNYNLSSTERENNIIINRIATNANSDTYFDQNGLSDRKYTSNNFKTGLDINLNKHNTLGFLINGYFNGGKELSNNQTLIGKSFAVTDSLTQNTSANKISYNNLSYNVNYKSILDSLGQEITADIDYAKYNNNNKFVYNNYFFNPGGDERKAPSFSRNDNPSIINISAFKVDYVFPFKRGLKFETGIKSSWVKTNNNLIFEEMISNDWQNDPKKSNQFIYKENINAAYINAGKEFKTTSIQVGLRAEQTNSNGNSITLDKVVDRSYIDYFPTFFINQNIGKNHSMSISYSRRIDRPEYDNLNPFVFYLDAYTFSEGNPFLNPQYTNSFELGYVFKKKYSATLSYTLTNDAIVQVILPRNEVKSLFQTWANLAKQTNYGLNLNIPVAFTKWWNSNNNINVFFMGFESPDIGGQILKNGRVTGQLKSQHTFALGKGFNAELNADYQSPMDYGTFKIQSQYNIDAGVGKSLINKKANVKFALSDIFNTRRNKISSGLTGLTYNVNQKNETRIARLSFTYRFGNNEIKPERRRSTGTESEQNRVKG